MPSPAPIVSIGSLEVPPKTSQQARAWPPWILHSRLPTRSRAAGECGFWCRGREDQNTRDVERKVCHDLSIHLKLLVRKKTKSMIYADLCQMYPIFLLMCGLVGDLQSWFLSTSFLVCPCPALGFWASSCFIIW